MKLHAQNQLSTSINFWDIKVLKASLVMPDHTHLNLHGQLITLIRYEAACKKIHFIPPIVFEIFKFKKPEIWLAKSILAFNSRTRFFPDMLWFKPIKFTYQQIFFLKFLRGKKKKTILGCFGELSPKWDIFPKIRLCQFFILNAT